MNCSYRALRFTSCLTLGLLALGSSAFAVTDYTTSTPYSSQANSAYNWLIAQKNVYSTGLVASFQNLPFAVTYDNAMTAIALLVKNDVANAKVVLSALQNCQGADGSFFDSYHANDGSVAYDFDSGKQCGNTIWVAIAVMDYEKLTGDTTTYHAMAMKGLQWVVNNYYNTYVANAVSGGLDSSGVAYTWASTEHNVDAYAAFNYFGYSTQATNVKSFLDNTVWHYDTTNTGHFYSANTDTKDPLDVNAWGVLSLASSNPVGTIDGTRPYSTGLAYNNAHHKNTQSTLSDPVNDFSNTESHSANTSLDTSNASLYFAGDGSRLSRSTNTEENVVYHMNNATSAVFRVYYYGASNNVVIKGSATGASGSFTNLSASQSAPTATSGGWYYVDYTASLPANSNYVIFDIPVNSVAAWTPQMGQATLTGPSITAYDFNSDMNDIWFEGSSFMVVADKMSLQSSAADTLVLALLLNQASNGGIQYSLLGTNNWYWTMERLNCLSSTTWMILGISGYDPYTSAYYLSDTAKNFSTTYAHTSNVVIDGTNAAAYFEGDADRFSRNADTLADIDYKVSNMSSASIRLYYYNTSASNNLVVKGSADGVNWAGLSATQDTVVATGGGWYRVNYTVNGIPSAYNYLRLEVASNGNGWGTQISQVTIQHN